MWALLLYQYVYGCYVHIMLFMELIIRISILELLFLRWNWYL